MVAWSRARMESLGSAHGTPSSGVGMLIEVSLAADSGAVWLVDSENDDGYVEIGGGGACAGAVRGLEQSAERRRVRCPYWDSYLAHSHHPGTSVCPI